MNTRIQNEVTRLMRLHNANSAQYPIDLDMKCVKVTMWLRDTNDNSNKTVRVNLQMTEEEVLEEKIKREALRISQEKRLEIQNDVVRQERDCRMMANIYDPRFTIFLSDGAINLWFDKDDNKKRCLIQTHNWRTLELILRDLTRDF